MATTSYAFFATPPAVLPAQPDNSYKQRLRLAWIKASPVNQACHANIRAEEGIRSDRQANRAPGKRFSVQTKAAESTPRKQSSIVCADCEGNGMVLCSQCKGSGVNSVDHFNGQFKAGGICWLCRGKREMLCGNCNGAGFLGGFMNTLDE